MLNFDTFGIPVTKYSNPLHSNIDYTYFMSQMQPGLYQYKKFSHSTMSATVLISSILISNYNVMDICNNGDTLDYIVATNTITNNVEIVTLIASGSTYIKNQAKRVKHKALIPETIHAKCYYTSTYNGKAVYEIGIAGSYLSDYDANVLDLYIGRFNTKANFTTNFYESETPGTSEYAKSVYVDTDNERIYAVVDINTNWYHRSTVYQAGDEPVPDNPNIAIVAMSFDFGTRLWTVVLGDKDYADSFSGLSIYNEHLYVLVTSHTDTFSTNQSQNDIIYTKIRGDNGEIENRQVMGSATDDKALDIAATTAGVYIMATIGDNFLPNPIAGNIWQAHGGAGKSNFAMLLIRDSDNTLIDIEGYDMSSMLDPYPKRFNLILGSGTLTFIMYSPKSNADIIGLYFTKFSDSTKVFINDTAGFCTDSTNCNRCNSNDPTMCMSCVSTKMLFSNKCYASCPNHSFQISNYLSVLIEVCRPCHYSCLTCLGPRKGQCQTCCTGGSCGTNFDRVPSFGYCNCPSGSKFNSNGYCLSRCSTGLRGNYKNFCYTDCPSDSIKYLNWGQSGTYQDYSNYDSLSPTQCTNFNNHLKFTKDGYGVVLPGPDGMNDIPNELTITIWFQPSSSFITYGRVSYLLNLFEVIQLYVTTSMKIRCDIGDSGATVQPTFASTNDTIIMNQWNYVTLSIQKQKTTTGTQLYIVVGLANGRLGTLLKAGEGTFTLPPFTKFSNIIYLGEQSKTTPNSFDGYLKFLRIFSKFHSFSQLAVDQLKIYQRYAYDDINLISQWDLNENYGVSDLIYTIKDYSLNMKNLTIYLSINPDYPSFVSDNSIALNLCTFHDVASCLTLDKSNGKLSKFVFGSWRLSYAPDLNLADSTITITDGDQIDYSQMKNCSNSEATLYRIYGSWQEDKYTPKPTDQLLLGTHYYLCYKTFVAAYATYNTFPLAQIYVGYTVDKVNPVELSSFRTQGVLETWSFEGGDQSYGDFIRFSTDCNIPASNDLSIMRPSSGVYSTVTITDFYAQQNIFFCYKSAFSDPINFYYEPILYNEYKIVERPQVSTQNPYTLMMNFDTRPMYLNGPLCEYDNILLSWAGNPSADCNPINFLMVGGYTFQEGFLPYIWYGKDSGIHGMNSTSNLLHVCWKSKARGAPDNWIRLKSTLGLPFTMIVTQVTNTTLASLPELESLYPPYGTTLATENTTEIQINFHSEEVYPAKSSNGYGILRIYRGAIKPDGTIGIATAAPVLWEDTQIDDTNKLDKFKQRDIECSLAGKCSVQLIGTSSLIAGEIYYLSLYPFTFKNAAGSYLFGPDATYGVSLYNHMFQCRSFNVISSNQIINGNFFKMSGENLISIKTNAMMNGNDILAATFKTRALKISMRITNSTLCSSVLPSGSIHLKNIAQSQFEIFNLDLKNCYQGYIYADFTIVRGIKQSSGKWTHLRKEYQKDVQLGIIGCNSACKYCNGPASNQCLLCSNSSNKLYNGTCISSCPSTSPYTNTGYIMYNLVSTSYLYCTSSCGVGTFADSNGVCAVCNPDCLTCTSNLPKSCLACSNYKALCDGICLSSCLSTSSTSPLTIQIQPLGFKIRVSKNIQLYPITNIYNSDPSKNIVSITWSQLDPVASNDTITIFSKDNYGSLINTGDSVKLKMSALNFMSSTQSIKLRVDITNSAGDTATDIFEFYANDAPYAKGTVFTNIGGVNNLEAMVTNFNIYAGLWYDSADDITQNLEFRVYFVLNKKNYMLTGYSQSNNNVTVQLPYLNKVYGGLSNITLCIEAKDAFDATTSLCQNYINVTSNYAGDPSVVFNPQVNLNMNNSNDIMYFAQNVNFVLNTYELGETMVDYLRPSAASYICTLDFHCNYNGRCDIKVSMSECVCEYGYFGTFCQYPAYVYSIVRTFGNQATDYLYSKYSSNLDQLSEFDVTYLSNVFNGLLLDYDSVSPDRTEKILQLFEGISNANSYTVPKDVYDIKIVYDAMGRLGAKITLQMKTFYKQSKFQHYSNLYGVELNLKISSDLNNLQNMYKRYRVLIQNFINKSIKSLNTDNPKIVYTSYMHDFSLELGFPYQFVGVDANIRTNDAFWSIPSTIFSNYKPKTAGVQHIIMKLAKWTTSPILFNVSQSNYLETNATEVKFFDTAGTDLGISGLSDPIVSKEPFSWKNVYDNSTLKCKAWNSTLMKFDGTYCSNFTQQETVLLCQTCDDSTRTTTNSSICSCNEPQLVVAQYSAPTNGTDESTLTVKYPDYFAMKYWQESFGFYLTITAVCVVGTIGIAVIFCDQFPRRKVLIKIYEKIKRREVEEGYLDEDSGSSSGSDSDSSDERNPIIRRDQGSVQKRSKLRDNENGEYHRVQNTTSVQMKTTKVNETEMVEIPDLNSGIMFGNQSEAKGERVDPSTSRLYTDNKNTKGLNSNLTEENKATTELHSEISQLENRESKSENEGKDKKSNGSNENDSEDKFERRRLREQAMKEYLDKRNEEEKKEEETHFYFRNLFIQGSFLQNFIWVDSYINPRHVRGVLFFTYIVLIWYVCAVYFNNTLDPKKVPDFNRKTRDLTFNEMWVSIFAPLGATILIYIFCFIFKISKERIKYTKTVSFLDFIIDEYGREHWLRYFMAYLILIAVHVMVFLYLIEFTAVHGWQTSWIWWNTGSLSFFINILIYDPLFAIIHYLIYKMNRKVGRFIMKIRNIKIYRPEV